MNKKNTKRTDKWAMLLIVAGIILGINLFVAVLSPDWTNTVQENAVGRLDAYFNSKVVLSESDTHAVTAGQGGVNVQRARDNAKRARRDIEGGGSLNSGTTESAETQSPAAGSIAGEKPPPPPPADSPAKKGAKGKQEIDPVVLKKALKYFQDSLSDRDVIWEGQTEPDRPYVSKSFRDNPFDKVEEINIGSVLEGLNQIPSEPFYPPPGESKRITPDELEEYLKTVSLQGIIVIDDRFYAVMRSGPRHFTRAVGDEFKDKFVINVVDISFENVLLSDEFGNKGLIGFDYARGFEAQSIDNVLYLSHYGKK
ncbi:hypothetical protein J7L05_09080 [bacterium]|nr:hypothetical protein [bacterium]